MDLETLRTVLRPGPGIAARFPGVALLIPSLDEEQLDSAREIIAAAKEASAATEPGRVLARSLAALSHAASWMWPAMIFMQTAMIASSSRQPRFTSAR